MAASTTFSSILNEIQYSNLNFKIELSPFSAVITLKKTAIKNSKGCSLIPSASSLTLLHQAQQENLEVSRQIFKLSLENTNLKREKKVADEKCGDFEKAIANLNHTLELSKVKTEVEENLPLISAETQTENLNLKKEKRRFEQKDVRSY